MTSRQERRAKLKLEMDNAARRGIQADAQAVDWWWAVIAETRFLIDILRGRAPKRASDAARHAHAFFENAVRHNAPDGPVECAKGCAFCCSLYVSATIPEVLHVADFIRRTKTADLPQVLERVRQTDRDTRYMDEGRRMAARFACPLLENGACSVYEARPGACRGLVSSSRAACERGYAGDPNAIIPKPKMWWQIRAAHDYALEAAMAESNLPSHSYSFVHALRIALENPDAETRWLKGDDVFASVEPDSFQNLTPKEERRARIEKLIAGATGQEVTNL